jgi:hypothetical protein
MIRYPLPVTMFTAKQCIQIQKPFVNAILPKIGLNRKTPRALVFGPKSLGGLEIMDLRVEQVAAQWETTKGHMRRLDRAGKGLYITAHDLQVQLGTTRPFYELDPTKYEYTNTCTRWQYLWRSMHDLNLKMHIYNFWTPSLKYENDRNIMDIAMNDRELISSKWNKLFHVNQCRLYLKAFNLSDLTHDGIKIHGPYLEGTEKGQNAEISIPDIRCPTTNQWRLWKAFIYRNFLSPGTTMNPPLGERVEVDATALSLPKSELDTYLHQGCTYNASTCTVLKHLHPSLKCLLGKVVWPSDGGQGVSEAIVAGDCIGASDGSLITQFRHQEGSYGYAISGATNNNRIVGYGHVPSTDKLSSMTTESHGLIGLLILLHVICKKFSLCEDECFGTVVIYIDNKTVVERGTKPQDLINLSDYNIPDQDLWSLITDLRKRLPISVKIKWIRGHQDRNKYGKRIYGPFNRDVDMNILVDRMAKLGMDMGPTSVSRRPNLSNTVVSLYDSKDKYISDIRRYITETVNGERMIDYMMTRRQWSLPVMHTIEWEGLEGLMRKANPIRRTRLLKMIHNWQNVGKQKGIMRDARLKLDSETPLAPTMEEINCELCPEGCKEVEGKMHFIHCPTDTAIAARTTLIRQVLRRLKALRTYEGITSNVGKILDDVSRRRPIIIDHRGNDKDGDMSLTEALMGQEKIGWHEFCQGFYHKQWSILQERHYRRNGIRSHALSIDRWKIMFSTILVEYSLSCWNHRNEIIHGKEIAESRAKQRKRIQHQVRNIYKQRSEVRGTKYYKIFTMALKKRLKLGLQANTIWIGMAEEALRLHREMMSKNTLNNWLIPI